MLGHATCAKSADLYSLSHQQGRSWMTITRQLALCASFLFLTGQTAPPPLSTATDFCSRLATDSGIDRPPTSGGGTEWTVNAMNFGQRFIFGGSAATGVGVTPVEPATVEDYQRLENMCMPEGKGAVCKLMGPVNFKFMWKGRKIVTLLTTGERATILVAGTKTTCRPES